MIVDPPSPILQMTQRLAHCACGALQASCQGEPARVSMCHCDDCQRRTGSAFSVAVFYAREAVTSQGAFKSWSRPSLAGPPVTFHFCPDCGSSVWWEAARMPDRIGVALGAFADPDFPAPDQSVWTRDKHRWIALPDDMIVHEVASQPRPAQV